MLDYDSASGQYFINRDPSEPDKADDEAQAHPLCEWYALCSNVSVGTVTHPILGEVPVCERCLNKHEESMLPLFTPYAD